MKTSNVIILGIVCAFFGWSVGYVCGLTLNLNRKVNEVNPIVREAVDTTHDSVYDPNCGYEIGRRFDSANYKSPKN